MSNNDSSEEEDYLSMDLTGLVEQPKEATYSERRKQKTIEQRQRGIIKPLRQAEKETREAGLSTRIEADNKGYELLKKMGYSEGMSLGRSMPGRAEPIPIVIRTKHSGLGHEEELKRKRDAELEKMKVIEKKRKEEEEEERGDFRERMMSRFAEKQIKGDTWKSRIACEQLDKAKGLEESPFWPRRKAEEVAEREGGDDDEVESRVKSEVVEEEPTEESPSEFELLEPKEQLAQVTAYLREVHLYCLWCGEGFESMEDMEEKCPGNTADVH
ncbi:G-patch-domain-containing protein [Basidiobolus meristosporus CBS 931.73]|uniref:G-patch-domain-containing protein n=1 Tax=Basidiobolus meristosporus CBS 931.73 TaxID=1314790 RepID=A0A1Y1YFE4_9FUNG|nr:G-patch-domain-containing protein [Basidiobolus meristosporus CBS 931.73]|eukprot:ORX96695.1 G-patch-domain-containing protein [Basidiobolus meristosporus CBS 931.73]